MSLPGRLALQNTADDGVRVHVRVIAFDVNDRATTMREARTQLPTDSVRALALPLLWMNSGEVIDNGEGAGGEDAIGRFGVRSCPDGQGLNDMGTCQSIEIDARGLPEFDEKKDELLPSEATCDPSCFDVAHDRASPTDRCGRCCPPACVANGQPTKICR